jgi:hypothetical protein
MIRRWLVAFHHVDPAERHWWHVLTRKGFNHVFIMGFDTSSELWVLMDWHHRGLYVMGLDGERADQLIAHVLDRGGCWLNCEVHDARPLVFPFGFPISCVGLAKHILGLRSWAVTPRQLYCALRRAGHRPIFDRTQQQVGE